VIAFERYAELLRVPGLGPSVAASVPGRIPIGVTALALLLFVQARTGSFAQAGSVAAFYVLGLAAVAPVLGRAIDRIGPRSLLLATALAHAAALLALVALVVGAAATAWVAAAALLAGATFPPITICMRALYPRLLADPALLRSAYSLDSALIEVLFIVGPALVALFVALGRPYWAVLFSAACAAAGGALFARTPAVRAWAPSPSGARTSLLGPLRQPRLLAILAAVVFYSIAFGLYEVAVTAFAAQKGHPAAAGAILALASAGSTAGALVYGSREWAQPLPRQFLAAVALMAAGLLLLAPLDGLYLFAAANVLAGAPMAAVVAAQSLLVSQIAPRQMLAESFTWSASALLGGVSLGIAAGGALAETLAPGAILAAAAAATLLSGAIVRALAAREEGASAAA
jgi:MFS family permease